MTTTMFSITSNNKTLDLYYYRMDVYTRGLHWVWAPAGPNANLAVAGGFSLCCGRSEKFAGSIGIWHVIEMESTHGVEIKIKAAV